MREVMRQTTVLLADDHVVFTDGIVRILSDRYKVVGAVSDGHELVEAALRLHPDIIVSDISMPTLSGLESLRQIKAKLPEARVILLTMHADPKLAADGFRLGARGFVLKQASAEELVKAIEAVLLGHNYMSAALTHDVLTLIASPGAVSGDNLRPRQTEVLRLIVNGLRMKEIASSLSLSPRTVETIKYEIMRDLDVHSTAELVKYAIEHKLVGF
jgi:DNA-binding NarL/FixJ family response regulator